MTGQLCLFSDAAMQAMTEQIAIKPVDIFSADPARLYWEMEIGQALQGKEGRQFRRTFTQRRVKVRVAVKKPPDIFIDS